MRLGLDLVAGLGSGGGPTYPWTIEDWIEGSDTTMTIVDGVVRVTNAGGNPRASRHITGLTEGWTYIAKLQALGGTGAQTIYRVSADANLTIGDYANIGSVTSEQEIDLVFTAPESGEVYIGLVEATSNAGEYGECEAEFLYFGRGDPIFDFGVFDPALFDVSR